MPEQPKDDFLDRLLDACFEADTEDDASLEAALLEDNLNPNAVVDRVVSQLEEVLSGPADLLRSLRAAREPGAEETAIRPGMRIGGYQLLAPIATRPMGSVWRAHDHSLDLDVALKILPAELDSSHVHRYLDEARMIAAMSHPGIVKIHGAGEQDGWLFQVMELVSGESLKDRLARGPLAIEEAKRVAAGIIAALDALHGTGIVHCDLKPANIQITAEGTVKIIDFGLAKTFEAREVSAADAAEMAKESETSLDRVIQGTPMYMSPEQWRGEPLDPRTDIWAFGCVLYEMIGGRPPFLATSVSELRKLVLTDEPNYSVLPPRTPAALVALMKRCLRKDRRRRPRSILPAQIALDQVRDGIEETRSEGDSGGERSRIAELDKSMYQAEELPLASTQALPAQVPVETRTEELVARYLPMLRRWASGRLPAQARSLADTDDLVQNAILRALPHLEIEPRHEGAYLAYMRGILMNEIRDAVRRAQRRPSAGVPYREELPALYEAALARLSEKSRKALVLRFEQAHSYAEVAEVLGCSPDVARRLIAQALVTLAREMRTEKEPRDTEKDAGA